MRVGGQVNNMASAQWSLDDELDIINEVINEDNKLNTDLDLIQEIISKDMQHQFQQVS